MEETAPAALAPYQGPGGPDHFLSTAVSVFQTVDDIAGGGGSSVTCTNQAGMFKKGRYGDAVGASFDRSPEQMKGDVAGLLPVVQADAQARSALRSFTGSAYPSSCTAPANDAERLAWTVGMAGSSDSGGNFDKARQVLDTIKQRANAADAGGPEVATGSPSDAPSGGPSGLADVSPLAWGLLAVLLAGLTWLVLNRGGLS